MPAAATKTGIPTGIFTREGTPDDGWDGEQEGDDREAEE